MAKTGPAPTKPVEDPRIDTIRAILANLNTSAEYKLHLIEAAIK